MIWDSKKVKTIARRGLNPMIIVWLLAESSGLLRNYRPQIHIHSPTETNPVHLIP